jgi:hypothetical protein
MHGGCYQTYPTETGIAQQRFHRKNRGRFTTRAHRPFQNGATRGFQREG